MKFSTFIFKTIEVSEYDCQKRRPGRPTTLNKTLINAICAAAENEILSHVEIYRRFNLDQVKFRNWVALGRQMRDGVVKREDEHAELSKELAERLDTIYEEHKEKLLNLVKEPTHAQAARLVLCLKPSYAMLEAAQ